MTKPDPLLVEIEDAEVTAHETAPAAGDQEPASSSPAGAKPGVCGYCERHVATYGHSPACPDAEPPEDV